MNFEQISNALQKILTNNDNYLTAFSFRTTSLLKTNRKPLYTTNIYFTNYPNENEYPNIINKIFHKTCNSLSIIDIKEFEHNVPNSITSIVFYDDIMYFSSGKYI